MDTLQSLQQQHQAYRQMNLSLNMQRGQPSSENFELSHDLLTIVGPDDVITPSGVDIRNYPGGPAGLQEARELSAEMLDVAPDEVMVGNNASLRLMADVLVWALLKGLKGSLAPWGQAPRKMIVTVPGYDRHFLLLERLGFELVGIPMRADGPDLDAVEAQAQDASVKGILFVPTYSNPTGDTLSQVNAERLACVQAAAPDFTIFADDAYRVHHLTEDGHTPANLLAACKAAGHPDRVILFGSTSKITFSGAGLGFLATSKANVAYLSRLFGATSIGPNKIEQYRHVKFLRQFPGGFRALMRKHAEILAPKFAAVQEVLTRELGGSGLATWTNPKGGYFIGLDTAKPVADRVVALADELGVSLTPAGATHPGGHDPHNRTIRIAPTRPPIDEVRLGMEVLAHCIKLASTEYDQHQRVP